MHYPSSRRAIHELSGIYESYRPIILIQFTQLKTDKAISLLHSLKFILSHRKVFIFYYFADVFGPAIERIFCQPDQNGKNIWVIKKLIFNQPI